MCFMSVLNAGETTGRALGFGPNVAQVRAAANRILGLRDSQVRDGPEATGAPFVSHGDGMKIELDNIHFKYPTRDVPVFQGLSLTIEKGQFAPLIGASGSGKSSIVSLLERFYDPDHGRILCNGQDIAANNVYTYRRHLSLVTQESSLFQVGPEDFCKNIEQPDHEKGWDYYKVYDEDTPDEHEFRISLSDDVVDYDVNQCIDSFKKLIHNCDTNRRLNWKTGGKYVRDDGAYT
ncbi:hypothetical protein FVER53590_09994 [Fusarium verticillioides]|nr:hypothetical protein FVER53590_09994 [Fusarium verticillioides]